ncbi:hypothetical protein JYU34_005063 [Plutella xylostella]|uniref:Uncharacterized protein n=1 Tax=Plutella xylostella TaxID=51655 RepID=A0ABQ7QVV6_PLUXY|nr:hypothetical protein JYU34_005063 [Plutella xylostella]
MLHRLLCLVIIFVQMTRASRPRAADPEEFSNRQHNSNQNQHNIAAPVLKSLKSPESYEFDSDSDEKPKKKTHKNIITDINEKSFQDKLKSNDRFQGVLEQGGAMLVEKFRPWENPNILSLITPAHPVVTRSPYVYP